jgi:hypothetical protein
MKKPTKITLAVAALAAGVALALAGCSTSATQYDQQNTDKQLQTYDKTQPVPFNNWSQYRQTVIDIEQAEVHGVATTTFFYNLGSNVPVKECPSIGFPVAITAQLTNPDQVAFGGNTNGHAGDYGTIAQQEPNGVYTGDSSGTYVVCIGDNGDKRIDYWEGYVETEGGPAHYDATSGQIVDEGQSTVVTKTK